ncbi:aminotransferase class IV [Faunimonas sp. B44]|uniref:aminotransferase class IV n=1 Tax=Faunimonas sp. B44 TaxID=3461493 RepID=UPI0040449A13
MTDERAPGATTWLNGTLGADCIAIADRGFLLGDGVFDTALALGRTIFAADRHLARLVAHAAAIGIRLDPADVAEAWRAVTAAMTQPHAIVRTTVTRGAAGRGLWPGPDCRPTLAVTAAAWDATLAGAPLRLATSTIRRSERSPLSRLKSLGYLESVLATREAAESGADDALLLNHAGAVACTTIANLFTLRGDVLATPPPSAGIMEGTMRATVLELAGALGLTVRQIVLSNVDLVTADLVFATNSVRILRPVTALDGAPIGSRKSRPFQALVHAVAGEVRSACGYQLLEHEVFARLAR